MKSKINKSKKIIPFFRPYLSREDKKQIMISLNSSTLTDGPKLREFERSFAKFTGAKFAIAVSNATSALHLSIKSLGIGKGDEVIVPDMTFVATANAVMLSGATPVFADVEKDSMNISIKSIEKMITNKTKAIIPVHFAGRACKMKEIVKLSKKNHLKIVEDCAHAIGAKIEGKHVGNFSSAGCFSFYPTKNITTIEGGMIITNSKDIAKNVTSLRNHGLTKTLMQRYSKGKPWDYDIIQPGYNYRLDEIRATLGISQLNRIKKINLLRKKVYEYYNKKFESIEGIITPKSSKKEDHAYHLYILKVNHKSKVNRNELFKKLGKVGIQTTVHYKPLHKFTPFKKIKKDKLKNSEELYEEIISLPFYPNISIKDQDIVINNIIKIVK
jgi:perosamine synthetase